MAYWRLGKIKSGAYKLSQTLKSYLIRSRILEHASTLDSFDLKYDPNIDLMRPLQLAKVAIGVIFVPAKGDKFYCPYPNCSALLDPRECLSSRVSSSTQSGNGCLECPVCQRFMCVTCGVPWHSSLTCEEYQILPLEERDAGDVNLHQLAQNERWKQCQQCRSMIEFTNGCYHMTCCCGDEFCYSCGAEYRDSGQTCQCTVYDEEEYPEDMITHPSQEFEQWAWDSFGSLSTMVDAYSEQERSQLALIQKFLAGGLSLSEHQPHQSLPCCTDSYGDSIKDLHQLPWLERFVSVISDNFYDEESCFVLQDKSNAS